MTNITFTVASDVHLEFEEFELRNVNDVDVLVLAGDIMVAEHVKRTHQREEKPVREGIPGEAFMLTQRYRQFFEQVSREFNQVLYVMGNHEHYQGEYDATADILRKEIERYHNVVLLDNEYIDIGGVRFLGSTLWTNANNLDQMTMYQISHTMNDYRCVRVKSTDYRKLTPEMTVADHVRSLQWIANNIRKGAKNVVVSHHAPTFQSLIPAYRSQIFTSGGYASDLSAFIEENPEIKFWLHGHCHNNSDYEVFDTRVICNPRGYHSDNYGFKPDLMLEV